MRFIPELPLDAGDEAGSPGSVLRLKPDGKVSNALRGADYGTTIDSQTRRRLGIFAVSFLCVGQYREQQQNDDERHVRIQAEQRRQQLTLFRIQDGLDPDCIDTGFEHWVGASGPSGLDGDGDGWACEGW